MVLPSVRAGFYFDDYFIFGILSDSTLRDVYPWRLDIFNWFDGSPGRVRRMLDLGLFPWWTFSGARVAFIAFWRPVSALTHWVDYTLWRDLPVLMHVQSLFWLGALIVAVFGLYRRLMTREAAAGLAALLYALDRTHAFPAVDIAGRNTILGALFGTLTLLFHDRWRRSGWRAGSVVAPACLALALLSAEAAVATGGYLVAHAVFLERGHWRGRMQALLPHGVVIAAWQLVYQWMGYGVLGMAPDYINPMREPLQFAGSLVRNWPVLLQAQWTGPPAESFIRGAAGSARWVVALATIAVLSILLAPLLKRDAVARFWALSQVLAVVPICAGSPHDRYLLLVGLGAMGLMAQFVCGLLFQEPWVSHGRRWRWAASLLACALIGIHLIVCPFQVVRISASRGGMEQAPDSIPADAAIRHQRLVIVNAPNALRFFHWFFVRAVKGQPIPAQTRVLSYGAAPLTIYRADAHTVWVRWEGRQEPISRPRGHPLVAGERVHVAGTDVEVSAVTDDGRPAEAIFRFDKDLDDPALRWLRWEKYESRFVSFRPPSIGETVAVQ